jgi:hypothetical protein
MAISWNTPCPPNFLKTLALCKIGGGGVEVAMKRCRTKVDPVSEEQIVAKLPGTKDFREFASVDGEIWHEQMSRREVNLDKAIKSFYNSISKIYPINRSSKALN